EPDHQEPPFCQIRVVFSPLYGDLLMKRPLRNRTVGAVRGGRGNPTLYSMYTQQCVPIGRESRAFPMRGKLSGLATA
ncbi:hypothetical protein, partial [Turicimonas muris]|uniref:hypothetical protein n=2 Tax=Turicimonas muris TaxID=1796652 RepID=UPI0025B43821